MEMSHRSKRFLDIVDKAREDFTALMNVPKGYTIFFLQGGATFLNTCWPLNLAKGKKTANYMTTGLWSQLAKNEALKYIKVNEVFNTSKGSFTRIPDEHEWNVDPEGAYFHFCHNETVHGVEVQSETFPWHKIPKGMPVVCDMSSNICSKPIDWAHIDIAYAGAQKNMGPSGIAVMVIKDSLIGNAEKWTPIMMDFGAHVKAPGMFPNTPNNWAIYMCGLNYAYMRKEGIPAIEKRNIAKAKILYDFIDASNGYYTSAVDKRYRSRMNVPFRICNNKALETKFVKEAHEIGLQELGGHALVGGCRASIYNAMPTEGVVKLVQHMKDFMARNPQSAKL